MKLAAPVDSRMVRRSAVGITALVWFVIVSPYPESLNGSGMHLVVGLMALDILLSALTSWIAFARTDSLDERQAALRDRAYRVAFRLVVLGVVIMFLLIFFGSIISSSRSGDMPQPQAVLGARWLVGLLELIIVLPTAVVAWLEPGSPDERRPVSWRRWLPLLVVPVVAVAWLLLIVGAPLRVSAVRDDASHPTSLLGAECGHFSASREAAYGFGAQVRLDVETCWDGKHAFAFRMDPQADLTRCEVPGGTADFARISNLSCTERTDGSGTMFYTVRAKVSPGLAPALSRDVLLELDVTREGKVLTFG